jgi:hypothetical protein
LLLNLEHLVSNSLRGLQCKRPGRSAPCFVLGRVCRWLGLGMKEGFAEFDELSMRSSPWRQTLAGFVSFDDGAGPKRTGVAATGRSGVNLDGHSVVVAGIKFKGARWLQSPRIRFWRSKPRLPLWSGFDGIGDQTRGRSGDVQAVALLTPSHVLGTWSFRPARAEGGEIHNSQ